MSDDFDLENATVEEKAAYAAGMSAATAKAPLTREEIRQMSTQEIMARKREVDAVLRQPIVKGEAGDDDE